MATEPQILIDARTLVARAHAGGPLTLLEVKRAQAGLRSLVAHPSTGDDLRGRAAGAMLVLEVIAASLPDLRVERVAS